VIPIKDDIPTRSFPAVTVTLIVMNVLVYLYEFALAPPVAPSRGAAAAAERAYVAFIYEFGLLPCRLANACPTRLATALSGAPSAWLTVFTSMFVHGGLFHVGGNMLYLWIFGNNVEDVMGRARFLVFYLVCGVAAAAAQVLSDPKSAIPMVGASGAVSGALGAYLLLYPHARIWVLVIFGFFVRFIAVPAVIVLGFWIVVQLANTAITFGRDEPGGVAFLAHVGGFLAGMALVHVFRQHPRVSYRRY
jgi:membrane associated rhomboid family serine protease